MDEMMEDGWGERRAAQVGSGQSGVFGLVQWSLAAGKPCLSITDHPPPIDPTMELPHLHWRRSMLAPVTRRTWSGWEISSNVTTV
jgi:hypothetical protein